MKDSNLLTEREAAKHLSVSPSWLRGQRRAGQGPKYITMGPRLIRYTVEDLDTYIKERTQ